MAYPSVRSDLDPSCGDVAAVEASLAQHDLDADPDGPHQTGGDHRDYDLECIALRLLHALPPSPQMLEVRPELFPIVILNSKEASTDAIAFNTIASMLSCRSLCCAASVSATMALISSSGIFTA
ncbi:hypothetical protein IVB14_32430 [Bradyrhizobium sp. 180]|jgi:hypothetical protein|nr:hypothetical protein [Bradyrhizobium sp. 180]